MIRTGRPEEGERMPDHCDHTRSGDRDGGAHRRYPDRSAAHRRSDRPPPHPDRHVVRRVRCRSRCSPRSQRTACVQVAAVLLAGGFGLYAMHKDRHLHRLAALRGDSKLITLRVAGELLFSGALERFRAARPARARWSGAGSLAAGALRRVAGRVRARPARRPVGRGADRRGPRPRAARALARPSNQPRRAAGAARAPRRCASTTATGSMIVVPHVARRRRGRPPRGRVAPGRATTARSTPQLVDVVRARRPSRLLRGRSTAATSP